MSRSAVTISTPFTGNYSGRISFFPVAAFIVSSAMLLGKLMAVVLKLVLATWDHKISPNSWASVVITVLSLGVQILGQSRPRGRRVFLLSFVFLFLYSSPLFSGCLGLGEGFMFFIRD